MSKSIDDKIKVYNIAGTHYALVERKEFYSTMDRFFNEVRRKLYDEKIEHPINSDAKQILETAANWQGNQKLEELAYYLYIEKDINNKGHPMLYHIGQSVKPVREAQIVQMPQYKKSA